MPKKHSLYTATCEDGNIGLFGQANTPDDAFNEFMSNGEFNEYCAIHGIPPGEEVEVSITGSTTFDEADEDLQAEMEHEGWSWVTDGLTEIRKAIAPSEE